MKRLALLLVSALLVGTFAVGCSDDDDSGSSDGNALRVGALLPLGGDLASYGETSQAALEAARDAINEESDLQVELVIEDTETDPETALSHLEALHADGISIVIGPYASSSVDAVKDFADENGIVLISPLSTATSLAVAGDNIYRFTPDDEKEGQAVAAVALDDGITTVIPVSRDDAGNLGLQSAMNPVFEDGGGTVLDGITYATEGEDFDAVVAELVSILEANTAAPEETAVYLTAFAEVTQLFEAASANDSDILTSVPWYGSDSVALSRELVGNETAAAFAVELGYPNPILGLREQDSDLWQPVFDDLQDDLDRAPDAFALAAYDALVVAHLATEAAGEDADASAIGEALVTAAADHTGLTGPSVLNDAGDRDSGSYDFWSVCPDGSAYTWTRTISFAPAGPDGEATIERFECE